MTEMYEGTSGKLARIRRDGSAGMTAVNWSDSRRARRGLTVVFLVLMVVFSAIPLTIDARNQTNKDYSLWYQVGAALRQGIDIYPDPATGRLFPFMYPPSAAAMLGFVSVLGKHGTTLILVLAHTAAWVSAIGLSVWLAMGIKRPEDRAALRAGNVWRQHPLLYIAPSLCIIALIHNTYLLGQPNLTLLALLLGAFACLSLGRQATAGLLVATAAAIKAFPILALGYLVYRRMWRASAATVAALAVWLLVVPLPFRTPAQAVNDVVIWSKGMVFTYNAQGIAQRPYRSFSYKNQSIMAMAHRLLRDVPADGEKVLSQHVAARAGKEERQARSPGMQADGSINLIAMLNADPAATPRWNELYEGIDEAMRAAWRVNVAALDFRVVTVITLVAMLGLSLFVVVAMPPRRERSVHSDAIEFALITLLIVMFSPLSFNYAFVWLLYPMTVAIHLTLSDPARGPWLAVERIWIAATCLIPGLAVFAPLYAQAYGNLFVPALMLLLGLGLRLRTMRRQEQVQVPVVDRAPHGLRHRGVTAQS